MKRFISVAGLKRALLITVSLVALLPAYSVMTRADFRPEGPGEEGRSRDEGRFRDERGGVRNIGGVIGTVADIHWGRRELLLRTREGGMMRLAVSPPKLSRLGRGDQIRVDVARGPEGAAYAGRIEKMVFDGKKYKFRDICARGEC